MLRFEDRENCFKFKSLAASIAALLCGGFGSLLAHTQDMEPRMSARLYRASFSHTMPRTQCNRAKSNGSLAAVGSKPAERTGRITRLRRCVVPSNDTSTARPQRQTGTLYVTARPHCLSYLAVESHDDSELRNPLRDPLSSRSVECDAPQDPRVCWNVWSWKSRQQQSHGRK